MSKENRHCFSSTIVRMLSNRVNFDPLLPDLKQNDLLLPQLMPILLMKGLIVKAIYSPSVHKYMLRHLCVNVSVKVNRSRQSQNVCIKIINYKNAACV